MELQIGNPNSDNFENCFEDSVGSEFKVVCKWETEVTRAGHLTKYVTSVCSVSFGGAI